MPIQKTAPRHHSGVVEGNLSWRARGVLSYAMTHEEPVTPSLIQRLGGTGRDAAKATINELIDQGYLDGDRHYIKQKIPEPVRREVLERDGFRCVECESIKRLSVDHIVPERLGGEPVPSNLRTLCSPCNSEKGVKQ